RCAITGCAVVDVLEAAHVTPYLGSLTNHVSNGLLLRTDLHTLFDCGLLVIEPKTRTVVIAEALKTSSYAKLVLIPLDVAPHSGMISPTVPI
ncbi:MAG TPA: HNH endonuclease signature motif containing protein, partial [Sphingomicrobium sp.]